MRHIISQSIKSMQNEDACCGQFTAIKIKLLLYNTTGMMDANNNAAFLIFILYYSIPSYHIFIILLESFVFYKRRLKLWRCLLPVLLLFFYHLSCLFQSFMLCKRSLKLWCCTLTAASIHQSNSNPRGWLPCDS